MKGRKIAAVVIAGSLLFSTLSPDSIQAAKKIRLNKTKVTLTEGKTVKLKLVGTSKKVKWSSSKKSIATVKNGKVTAKKKGKCKIKAKVGSKKYSCSVTVKAKTKKKVNSEPTPDITATPYNSEIKVTTPPAETVTPIATSEPSVVSATNTPSVTVTSPTSEPTETANPANTPNSDVTPSPTEEDKTVTTSMEPGLYNSDMKMVYSWDELLDNEYITVTDGEITDGSDEDKLIGNLVISSDVTSIGRAAFVSCGDIQSIKIPDSVTSIGVGAFGFCNSIESIEIPSSVTSIDGDIGLATCSKLKNIVVDSDNLVYDSRENSNSIIVTETNELIAGCKTTVIPWGVTSIGEYAFYGCDFTHIELPNSITNIGYGAFVLCDDLKSIKIPYSVVSIGERAFVACTSLKEIDVEDNNDIYDSRNNCNAVIVTATDELIAGCQTTEIPLDVLSIGDFAFSGCTGLTEIKIPEGVRSIGIEAFGSCGNMESVEMPKSMTSIGQSAFHGCKNLVNIEIPDAVTSIGDMAFSECSSLTIMKVNENNTVYDSRDNCNAIIATDTNELIAGCQTTEIPSGVTSIGGYAFYECDLKSIEIPDGVTSIGHYAFYGCKNLVNIEIPDSVAYIGIMAFSDCSNLNNIYCQAKSKPYNWSDDWQGNNNATVVWDCQSVKATNVQEND